METFGRMRVQLRQVVYIIADGLSDGFTKGFHMKKSCLAALLVFNLAAMPVIAAEASPDREAVQAAVAEAKARLKLTPEQEAQLRPLTEEHMAQLKAIKAKHAGAASRSEKRAMFKEARPVMDDYHEKVRAILTDEQQAEWEKMRAEAKERFKEHRRSGNDPE